MAKGFSLSKLRDDIRWQSDLEEADLRLTDSALTERINESIARYRQAMSTAGSPVFLSRFETTTPKGASRNEAGRSLNWSELNLSTLPVQIEDIYGIDISVNDITYELQSTTITERNRHILSGNYPGVPESWFLIEEATLCLTPPCDSGYPLSVWYLPESQDLEDDEDIFDPIIKSGKDWVIWDVISDIATRDNYPHLASAAGRNKRSIEADVQTALNKRGRDMPNFRKNTRQRRLNRRTFRYFSSRHGS